jgi:hypothetical protein
MLVGIGGSGTSPDDPPAPKPRPSAKPQPPTSSTSATASGRSNPGSSAPSTAVPADTTFEEIHSIAAAKTAAAQAQAKAAQAQTKAAAASLQQDAAQTKQPIERYARTLPGQSMAAPTATELSAKAQAEKSSFNLLMDYCLVKQGVRDATNAVYVAKEQTLLRDPSVLARIEAQFGQSEKGSGLSRADLQSLAWGGEVAAGEQLLPKSQQTTPAIQAYGAAVQKGGVSLIRATTALQRAGFLEEVMTYERANGLALAMSYSPQWNKDAWRFLSNPLSVRGAVIAAHAQELSANGLDEPTFYAQLWASEVVGKALLQQKQGGDESGTGKAVATIAAAFYDPNGSSPNGNPLNPVVIADNALDPILARQALTANSYVKGLPRQIAAVMAHYAGRSSHSQADAIQWLSDIAQSASGDPKLATAIVKASSPTLQTDLKGQTGAPADQAAQAYLAAGEIYFVMQKAAAAGMSDAGALANDIAQLGFNAISATSDTSHFNGHTGIGSQGQLDEVLGAMISQARQAPGNLFKVWQKLAQRQGGPLASVAWGAFQSVLTDAPLAPRSVTPTVERPAPTVSEVERVLEAKTSVGESLQQAISATRAQMSVDYGPAPGHTNELRLAEAALALAGENNLQVYFQDPSSATDPIAVASSQIAALDAFEPADLKQATAIMTATKSPNLAALRTDAARASSALQRWQADAVSNKPAAIIGQDEQAYHAALLAELNDASGETGGAWLNNPVDADRLGKAEYAVGKTNLAPLRRSGNHQTLQAASMQLQTSLEAVSILADVGTVQRASRDDALAVQELTGDLGGLSPTDSLYQEVMGDGSVRARLASSQADIMQAANARLRGGSKLTPEARLANAAKVLAEYQGTVFYAPLLHATEQAPVTQQLFDAVARGPLTDRRNTGAKLTQVASVMSGLQADPDLAAALYQEKFANRVRFWIAHYPSQGDEQTYYAALGQIYVDVGSGESAQGAGLRAALAARMNGDDPVATPTLSGEGGRAGALDPGAEHVVLTYDLGGVKAADQPTQLYQDIIDETSTSAATQEIESETGFRPRGRVPTPINHPNTDPVGLAGVDGLSALTTKAELINELGQAENLTPAHLPQTAVQQTALSEGQYPEFNLSQKVYGNTTLGDLLKSTLASTGVTRVSAQTPVVLTALPLDFTSATGQLRALSLLEIDGVGGQTRYVGPANATWRSRFSNWIEYNGFGKGELLAQAHPVFGSNGKILQGRAYAIANQTGITTWDKVGTYTEIGLTVAAGLVTTFVDPATAPLWLAVASELADAWFAYQTYQGITQSAQALSTAQGRGDWVNWLNLGASSFGEAAAEEGMASRTAAILSRLGVEDDTFAAAWNLKKVIAGKDVLEAERGMASANGLRPTLAFEDDSWLKRFSQAGVQRTPGWMTKLPMSVDEIAAAPVLTDAAGNPARLRTLLQGATQMHLAPLLFRGVGGAAMVTNLGSMGVQLAEMKAHGATPSAVLQVMVSAGVMGLGFGMARAHGQASPGSTEVVWAEPDPDEPSKYAYRTLRQAPNGQWVADTGPLGINGDPAKYRLVFVRSSTDDGQMLVVGRLSKLQSGGSYKEVYSKGLVWSKTRRWLPDDRPPADPLETAPDGRQTSDAQEKIAGSGRAGALTQAGAGHFSLQMPADRDSASAAFEVPAVVKVGANNGSVTAGGVDPADASISPPRIVSSQAAPGLIDPSAASTSGSTQSEADVKGAVGASKVILIVATSLQPTAWDPVQVPQEDGTANSSDNQQPSRLITDPLPAAHPPAQPQALGRAASASPDTGTTENDGAADPRASELVPLATMTALTANLTLAEGAPTLALLQPVVSPPAAVSFPPASRVVQTTDPTLEGDPLQASGSQTALAAATADARPGETLSSQRVADEGDRDRDGTRFSDQQDDDATVFSDQEGGTGDTDGVGADSTNDGSAGARGDDTDEAHPPLELRGGRRGKPQASTGSGREGLVSTPRRPASTETRLPESLIAVGRVLDDSNRYYAARGQHATRWLPARPLTGNLRSQTSPDGDPALAVVRRAVEDRASNGSVTPSDVDPSSAWASVPQSAAGTDPLRTGSPHLPLSRLVEAASSPWKGVAAVASEDPVAPGAEGPRSPDRPMRGRSQDPDDARDSAVPGAASGNVPPPPPPPYLPSRDFDLPEDLPDDVQTFRERFDKLRHATEEHVLDAAKGSPLVPSTAAQKLLFEILCKYVGESPTATPLGVLMSWYKAARSFRIVEESIEDLVRGRIRQQVAARLQAQHPFDDDVKEASKLLDDYLEEFVSGTPMPLIFGDRTVSSVTETNSAGGVKLIVRSRFAPNHGAPARPGEIIFDEGSDFPDVRANSVTEVHLQFAERVPEWPAVVANYFSREDPGRLIVDHYFTTDQLVEHMASFVDAGYADVRAEQLGIRRHPGGTLYRIIGYFDEWESVIEDPQSESSGPSIPEALLPPSVGLPRTAFPPTSASGLVLDAYAAPLAVGLQPLVLAVGSDPANPSGPDPHGGLRASRHDAGQEISPASDDGDKRAIDATDPDSPPGAGSQVADAGAVAEPAERPKAGKTLKLYTPSRYGLEVDAARRAIIEYIERETAQGRPAPPHAAEELSRLMRDHSVSKATSIDRAAQWMEVYNFPEDAAKEELREFVKSKNRSQTAKWAIEQLLGEWRGGPPRIAIGARLVVSPGKADFEAFPGKIWLDVNQLFLGPRP